MKARLFQKSLRRAVSAAPGRSVRSYRVVLWALLLYVGALGACSGSERAAAPPKGKFVYTVEIEGAISGSTMDRLEKAIKRAEDDGARALIVLLNTPGGYMVSMDRMCQAILNAQVPVITFVHPSGAYAGSAGVYIMYASHLAAMTNPSNIGSATPVMSGGGGGKKEEAEGDDRIPQTAGSDDATNMKRKLFHHAMAQIRSFAEFHGRNADFAERTITEAANITSREALRINAIDVLADSPEHVLELAHGRSVRMKVKGRLTNVQLDLKGASIVPMEADFRADFLSFLTNPAIVNLLMMFGVLGIFVEIQYPGNIFPGAVGAMCLIMGLFGMQQLSVDYAAYALFFLGALFFVLEIKIISYGLLSIAGAICFIIGSILLARSGGELALRTLVVAVSTSAAFSGFMALLLYKAVQVMRREPTTGGEAMAREIGRTKTEITEEGGHVWLHGELWSARAAKGRIAPNTDVRVVRRQALVLYVLEAGESDEPGSASGESAAGAREY